MATPRDPEQELEHTADELEERLGSLDDHIGDAQKLADDRLEEAGGAQGPEDDPGARAAAQESESGDESGDEPDAAA